VTGLSNCTAYTFTVAATTAVGILAVGTSPSNSRITPSDAPRGAPIGTCDGLQLPVNRHFRASGADEEARYRLIVFSESVRGVDVNAVTML